MTSKTTTSTILEMMTMDKKNSSQTTTTTKNNEHIITKDNYPNTTRLSSPITVSTVSTIDSCSINSSSPTTDDSEQQHCYPHVIKVGEHGDGSVEVALHSIPPSPPPSPPPPPVIASSKQQQKQAKVDRFNKMTNNSGYISPPESPIHQEEGQQQQLKMNKNVTNTVISDNQSNNFETFQYDDEAHCNHRRRKIITPSQLPALLDTDITPSSSQPTINTTSTTTTSGSSKAAASTTEETEGEMHHNHQLSLIYANPENHAMIPSSPQCNSHKNRRSTTSKVATVETATTPSLLLLLSSSSSSSSPPPTGTTPSLSPSSPIGNNTVKNTRPSILNLSPSSSSSSSSSPKRQLFQSITTTSQIPSKTIASATAKNVTCEENREETCCATAMTKITSTDEQQRTIENAIVSLLSNPAASSDGLSSPPPVSISDTLLSICGGGDSSGTPCNDSKGNNRRNVNIIGNEWQSWCYNYATISENKENNKTSKETNDNNNASSLTLANHPVKDNSDVKAIKHLLRSRTLNMNCRYRRIRKLQTNLNPFLNQDNNNDGDYGTGTVGIYRDQNNKFTKSTSFCIVNGPSSLSTYGRIDNHRGNKRRTSSSNPAVILEQDNNTKNTSNKNNNVDDSSICWTSSMCCGSDHGAAAYSDTAAAFAYCVKGSGSPRNNVHKHMSSIVASKGQNNDDEDDISALCYDSDPEDITRRLPRHGLMTNTVNRNDTFDNNDKQYEVSSFLRKGGAWEDDYRDDEYDYRNNDDENYYDEDEDCYYDEDEDYYSDKYSYNNNHHHYHQTQQFQLPVQHNNFGPNFDSNEYYIKQTVEEFMNKHMTLKWHRITSSGSCESVSISNSSSQESSLSFGNGGDSSNANEIDRSIGKSESSSSLCMLSTQPLAVRAWVERGQHLRGGRHVVQPKFVFVRTTPGNTKSSNSVQQDQDTNVISFDLLDIVRILKLDCVDDSYYTASNNTSLPPICKRKHSFLIETTPDNNDTADEMYIFETSSEDERNNMIFGLKTLVARLGSKIIVGDPDIFDEFFVQTFAP